MEPAKQPRLWQPLLVFVVIVVGGWWLLNTITTGNPLWFRRTQPAYTPERIVVFSEGERYELGPDDADFAPLDASLKEVLSAFRNADKVDVGLSQTTLADYKIEGVVVEAHYGEDIVFNLPTRFVRVNTLLIPVVGRHSQRSLIFLGTNGAYQAGALQATSRLPLDETLQELGYLTTGE